MMVSLISTMPDTDTHIAGKHGFDKPASVIDLADLEASASIHTLQPPRPPGNRAALLVPLRHAHAQKKAKYIA